MNVNEYQRINYRESRRLAFKEKKNLICTGNFVTKKILINKDKRKKIKIFVFDKKNIMRLEIFCHKLL